MTEICFSPSATSAVRAHAVRAHAVRAQNGRAVGLKGTLCRGRRSCTGQCHRHCQRFCLRWRQRPLCGPSNCYCHCQLRLRCHQTHPSSCVAHDPPPLSMSGAVLVSSCFIRQEHLDLGLTLSQACSACARWAGGARQRHALSNVAVAAVTRPWPLTTLCCALFRDPC